MPNNNNDTQHKTLNVHLKNNGCKDQYKNRHNRQLIRLPSNLRQSTCKYIYLVGRGHFQSRNKNGVHTTVS